jgi:hypothetical protein
LLLGGPLMSQGPPKKGGPETGPTTKNEQGPPLAPEGPIDQRSLELFLGPRRTILPEWAASPLRLLAASLRHAQGGRALAHAGAQSMHCPEDPFQRHVRGESPGGFGLAHWKRCPPRGCCGALAQGLLGGTRFEGPHGGRGSSRWNNGGSIRTPWPSPGRVRGNRDSRIHSVDQIISPFCPPCEGFVPGRAPASAGAPCALPLWGKVQCGSPGDSGKGQSTLRFAGRAMVDKFQ